MLVSCCFCSDAGMNEVRRGVPARTVSVEMLWKFELIPSARRQRLDRVFSFLLTGIGQMSDRSWLCSSVLLKPMLVFMVRSARCMMGSTCSVSETAEPKFQSQRVATRAVNVASGTNCPSRFPNLFNVTST
jgi:hypothetical protein